MCLKHKEPVCREEKNVIASAEVMKTGAVDSDEIMAEFWALSV